MNSLYVFTSPGSCRACSAPLLWFRTPAGKNIPIDDGKPEVSMLERGDTFEEDEAKEKILPHNHFATCPENLTPIVLITLIVGLIPTAQVFLALGILFAVVAILAALGSIGLRELD